MSTRLHGAMLLGLLSSTPGCSAPNPHVRVRRLANGHLEVQGPLAGPFKTQEALADNACELMTRQPGADGGGLGKEYCALGYFAQEERAYYLSYLSDLGGDRPGGTKFCTMPSALDDPSHPVVLILMRLHTHPHNRRFSNWDLSAETGWEPAHLFDKTAGQFMERYLLEFYREKAGECRVYRYSYPQRIVATLRDGQWVPIGRVVSDSGNVQLFEGQDWVP